MPKFPQSMKAFAATVKSQRRGQDLSNSQMEDLYEYCVNYLEHYFYRKVLEPLKGAWENGVTLDVAGRGPIK